MNHRRIMAAALCGMLTTAANAELNVTRHSSVSDAFGGSLIIDSAGTVDMPGADLISQAAFLSFHPGDQTRSISGNVTRTLQRSAESAISTYNGSLVITGVDEGGNAKQTTLDLTNFQVQRSDEGPELSGTVVLDGKVLDATQIPEKARKILIHALRFFHYD